MNINFTKMHGIGNDFIVIDARDLDIKDYAGISKTICHRRFGIGADQMLLLLKSDSADMRMRIFNSDGSEVEMCGNGIRCLAKYIWDRGISSKETLDIETLAGIIRPKKAGDMVMVDMGEPRLYAEDIPIRLSGRVKDYPIEIEDKTFSITCVSMGNPHAVIFMDNIDSFPVTYYGPLIETNPLFPMRTNVEFIEVLSKDRLKMRVWERGAGETMACGTGACASLVAASLNGLSDRKAVLSLTGGELFIEWAEDNRVYMTGPAVEGFIGDIEI